MDIAALKAKKLELNTKVDELSAKLNSYPKGEMGLVVDKSDEFVADKQAFAQAFAELRDFNGKYTKILRKAQ